jgi:hypothetical protein
MRLRPSDGSGASSMGGVLAAQAAYTAAVAPLPWAASIEWHFGGDAAAGAPALPPGARMPLDATLPALGTPPVDDGVRGRPRVLDVLPRLLRAVAASEGASRDAVLRGERQAEGGEVGGRPGCHHLPVACVPGAAPSAHPRLYQTRLPARLPPLLSPCSAVRAAGAADRGAAQPGARAAARGRH